MLDERKRQVLKATVINYIETAEPVGSKYLTEKHQFHCSPATVRHELNELEKDGYLTQVHTSSGRVPTDKGYRFYVDCLMPKQGLNKTQQAQLSRNLLALGHDLQDVLQCMSRILSSVLNYTAIILTPDIYQETLKAIQFVLADLNKIWVLLLNSSGLNQEFSFQISAKTSQDELNVISSFLTQYFYGEQISSIRKEVLQELAFRLPALNVLLEEFSDELQILVSENFRNREMVIQGISNMITLPEFRDPDLTQKVLATLEESQNLLRVLSSYNTADEKVIIGHENTVENLWDCSMVIAPYTINNRPAGAIGILGPKRMTYEITIPVIHYVSGMVTRYFDNPDNLSV